MEANTSSAQNALTVLNDELIGFRNLLWTIGRCRKEARCRMTGMLIPEGSMAWRPLGNPANRYERISASWMAKQRAIMGTETSVPAGNENQAQDQVSQNLC